MVVGLSSNGIKTLSIRPLTVTDTIVPRRNMSEANIKQTLKIADIPRIQPTMVSIERMVGGIKVAMTDGEIKTETTIEATPTRVNRATTTPVTTRVIGMEWRWAKMTVKRESRFDLKRMIGTRTPITATTSGTETRANIRVHTAWVFSAATLTAMDSGDNSRSAENSERIATASTISMIGSQGTLVVNSIRCPQSS
jgi:hypothetical protein